MDAGPRILLGSASPRRAELLRAAGLRFEIEKPDVDETLPAAITPERAACLLAERKARAVAARHTGDAAIVIGADTIVAVDVGGRTLLLGKPADEREAEQMLGQLSGSRHRVVTGVSLVHARRLVTRTAFERSWVTMRVLTAREIAAYVEGGEWRDKAGGYAIQESADRFVTRIEEGGFDNVVGLPVTLTLRLLDEVTTLAAGTGEG